MGPIESRQSLYGFDIRQNLIYIHRMKQRLIIARLEFIGNNKKTIGVFLEAIFNLCTRKSIQRGFGHPSVLLVFIWQLLFSGECDYDFILASSFFQQSAKFKIVIYSSFDTAGHDHCTSLSSYFPFVDDIRMEVLNHNSRFVVDCSSIAFNIGTEFGLCLFIVE